jgi:L-fuculose-phosphate aldolase
VLADVVRRIAEAQATFGTSGNASERSAERDAFWITPSGVPWQRIAAPDLVELDASDGSTVCGALKPSTEWRAHQALYQAHPWVGGVVHLHSPYATTLAVIGSPIRPVHYQIARIGDEVPMVPYATFGTVELAQSLAQAVSPRAKGVLVSNHGLFTVGSTVEEAWTFAQEIEWTAMIQYQAMLVGTPRVLTPADLDAVREAFSRYGQTSEE